MAVPPSNNNDKLASAGVNGIDLQGHKIHAHYAHKFKLI